MAAVIASKSGAMSLLTKGVSGSTKLLAAAAAVNKAPSANIYSKTSGNLEPRLPPWNYKKWGFEYMHSLFDGTTKRLNDNSKMLVVEGPPALGKTEVAKALADEFDMVFVPGFDMEKFYINTYGYDLRELDYKVEHDRCKSYDEKKFAQDPTGQDGGLDRMLYQAFACKYMEYSQNLAHIFNTGQGVVTERSPHSDWIYFDAAFRQGWIDRTTRQHYWKTRNMYIDQVLRPNLIIHLDAPVDVVQSKIRARSKTTHPWEANSPVWENTDYLEHLYGQLLKKQYLRDAAEYSLVLSYDWSEGGDVEVVVEDIERLNLDYHDKYDKQQKDWRLLTEDGFASKRQLYTNGQTLRNQFIADPFWSADKLILSNPEGMELEKIKRELPGNEYLYGYNTILGDPEPFFNWGGKSRENTWADVPYAVENNRGDVVSQYEDRRKLSRKAAGLADWWKL